MVPTRTGKPVKMGEHFPVREKSRNFDQIGKEFYPKYWKIRKFSHWKLGINTGKVREIWQSER